MGYACKIPASASPAQSPAAPPVFCRAKKQLPCKFTEYLGKFDYFSRCSFTKTGLIPCTFGPHQKWRIKFGLNKSFAVSERFIAAASFFNFVQRHPCGSTPQCCETRRYKSSVFTGKFNQTRKSNACAPRNQLILQTSMQPLPHSPAGSRIPFFRPLEIKTSKSKHYKAKCAQGPLFIF